MAAIEAEVIANIGGFHVTNSLFTTLIVDAVLIALVFVLYKQIKLRPTRLQSFAENILLYFYDLCEQLAGSRVKSIFPWVMSFFLFILFSNLIGLLPGVGSIGLENTEGLGLIPLLRPGTSDFNTTLALATISLVATHVLSIKYTGIKDYLSRFFSLNPIFLFVGVLELISEFTKLFSLSFRLFGNIFAGEVVLATVSELFAFIAPIPFLMLESIVALVQALVFAMLTLVFMSIFTTPHHSEKH